MDDLNDVINDSKIPDSIKLLPSYDGDSQTLHHWLTQVENFLKIYDAVRQATPFGSDLFALEFKESPMKPLIETSPVFGQTYEQL